MTKRGPNLNDDELKVLGFLVTTSHTYDEWFFPFTPIARTTRLNRKQVRRACRSLARKGLAKFGRGLFTEEGEVAGSGYACTSKGRDALPEMPDG